MQAATLARTGPRQHGFTLIELMITVGILGIIAALAYPSFMQSLRKGHRSDAFAALSAVQQAQERWRSNSGTYADNDHLTPLPSASDPGLGLSATSSAGYYTIVISASSATGYTVTATAVAGKSQAQDAGCQVLAVQMNNGNIGQGSGASSADYADPGRCWAK